MKTRHQKLARISTRLAGWGAVAIVALSGLRASAYDAGANDLFQATQLSIKSGADLTSLPLSGACGPNAAACIPPTLPLSDTTYAVDVASSTAGDATTIVVGGTVDVAGSGAATKDVCTGNPSSCITVQVVPQAGSLCTGGGCVVSANGVLSIPGTNRVFSAELQLNPASFVGGGSTSGWLLLSVTMTDLSPALSETEYFRVDYTSPAAVIPQVCFTNLPGENERRSIEGGTIPKYWISGSSYQINAKVKPNTGTPTPATPNLNGVNILFGGPSGTLEATHTGPYAAEANNCSGAAEAGWLSFQRSVTLPVDAETDIHLRAQNTLSVNSVDDTTPPDDDDLYLIRDASNPTFGPVIKVRDASNAVATVSAGSVSVTNASPYVMIEGTFSDIAPGRVSHVSIDTTNQAVTAALATSAAGSTTTTINGTGPLSEVTDYYRGWTVTFSSGALNGQSRQVSAYNGTTKQLTLASAFGSAPANGDSFTVSPMSGATTISIESTLLATLSEKAPLKVSDIIQFVNEAGQLNQGKGVRITALAVSGVTTTVTLAPNAIDGTPVVYDPSASFLVRHTGFSAMDGVITGCPGACLLSLPGGASTAQQKAWDQIFTTGAPDYGRGLGVNDFIYIETGATGSNLTRRWRITSVNTGARTVSLSAAAVDGSTQLANDATVQYFVYDAVSAAGTEMQAVDGEDAKGGYLCNPCAGEPFRIDLSLKLGPNFVTIYLVDDAGRTTTSQFTINYTTPVVAVAPPDVYFTRMLVTPTYAQAQSLLSGQTCTGPSCLELETGIVMGTGANQFSINGSGVLTVAGGGVDFTALLQPGTAVRVGTVHTVVKRVNSATSAQVLLVRGTLPVGPLTGATRHRMTKPFSDRVIGTYEGLRVEGVVFTDPAADPYDTTTLNRTPDLYINGVNLTTANMRPLTDPELPAGFTRAFHFTYTERVAQYGSILIGASPTVVAQPSPTEYVVIQAAMVTNTSLVTAGGLKPGDFIQVPLLNSGNRIKAIGVLEQPTGGTFTCNGQVLAVGHTCVRITPTVYAGGPSSTLNNAVRKASDGVQTDLIRVVHDNVPDPKPERSLQNGYATDRTPPSIGLAGVSESYINVTAAPQLSITDTNLSLDSDNDPSTGPTGFRLYQGVYVLLDPTNPSRTTGKLNYDFSVRQVPLNASLPVCYPAQFFNIDDPNSPTYRSGSVASVSITPKTVFNGAATLVNQDEYYKGWKIKFTSGNASLIDPERTIVQYVGATRTITVSPEYLGTPAPGDTFVLYNWDKPRAVETVLGTVISGTQFTGTTNISTADNLYTGDEVTFTSGANAGKSFTVTGYTNARRFTVTPGLPFPAVVGDKFIVRTRGRTCQIAPSSFPQSSGFELIGYTLGDDSAERGGFRMEVWAQDSAVPPNVTATSSAPMSVNFGVVLTPEQATVNDFIMIFGNVDAACPKDRYGRDQSIFQCFLDPVFTTLSDNPTSIRGGGDVLNAFFEAFAFVIGNAGGASGAEEVATNPMALTALGGFQDLFPGLFSDGDPDSDIVTFINILKNGIDRQIFKEIPLITLDAMYDPDNNPVTADGLEALEPTFRTLLSLDGERFRVDTTSTQDKSSSPFMRVTPAILDVLQFDDLRSTLDVVNRLRVMDVDLVRSGIVVTEKRQTLEILYDLFEAAVDLYDTSYYVDSVNGNSAFVYDANANGIAPESGEVVCASNGFLNIAFRNKLSDCYCSSTGAPAWCVNTANIVIDPTSDSRSLGRAMYILQTDACAAEGYNQAACNASVIYKDSSLKSLRTIMHEFLAPDPSTGVSDLSSLQDVLICELEPIDDGSANVRDSPIGRIIPTIAALVNQTGARFAAECTLGGQIRPDAITASYATCTSSRATLRRVDGFRRMGCYYDNGTPANPADDILEGQIQIAAGRAPSEFCTSGELVFPDSDALSLLLPATEYLTDQTTLNQITRLILQFPDTDVILNLLVAAHDQGQTKRIVSFLGQLFDLDNRGRRSSVPECGTAGAAADPPACRLAGLPNIDTLLDSMNDLLTSPRSPYKAVGTCTSTGRSAPCFDSLHYTPFAGFLDTFDEMFVKNPPACCTCVKPNGTGGWRAPTSQEITACQGVRGKDFDPQNSLWKLLGTTLMDELSQAARDELTEMIPTLSAFHTGANSPAGNKRANFRRFVPGPRDPYFKFFVNSSSTDDGPSIPTGGNERNWSTYYVEGTDNRTLGWSQNWPPDRAFPTPMMCSNGKLWTGTDTATTTAACPTSRPIPYSVNVPVTGDANYMHPNTGGGMNGIRTHGRNPFDEFMCDDLNCCVGAGDTNPRCNMNAQECGGTSNPTTNYTDCLNKGRLNQRLPNPYYLCTTTSNPAPGAAAWWTDVQGWPSSALPETPVDCHDSPDLLRALDESFRSSTGVDLGSGVSLAGLYIPLDFLLSANQLVSDVGGFSDPPLLPTVNLTYKIFAVAAPKDKEQLLALFFALFGSRGILTGGLSSFIRYDSEGFGSPSQTPQCTGFVAAETQNQTLSADTKVRLVSAIDRTTALKPLVDLRAFDELQKILVKFVGIANVKESNPAVGLYQTQNGCDPDCVNGNCGTNLMLWGQAPAILQFLTNIEVLGFGSPVITGMFSQIEEGPDREVLDAMMEVLGDFYEVTPDLDPRLPPGRNGWEIFWDALDNMVSPADGSTVPTDSQANPYKEPFLYPLAPALYQIAGVKSRGAGHICRAGTTCNGQPALTGDFAAKGYAQLVVTNGMFVDYNPASALSGIVDCKPGAYSDASVACDPTVNPDYVRVTCTRNAVSGGSCIIGSEDGTAYGMTFSGTNDKRSHTGHLYKIVEKIDNNRIIIDPVAIDDPGIIIQNGGSFPTQTRNVEFTVVSSQRAGIVRAGRAIGRAILNDLNLDPDIPGFDASDLDSIIADVLRCDTDGLLLDTLMYYIDNDPSNGDIRRLRNAIYSLKPQPAIQEGLVDAIGNLLGATGGKAHLGVEGRAPIAQMIPFLREGAIEDPKEQLALQRSVDNLINPFNPDSNARLNRLPNPCTTADPSQCKAFVDPVFDIVGTINTTNAFVRSTGANPLSAECWVPSLSATKPPQFGGGANPCTSGGKTDFKSLLRPILGGAGVSGLDVRTKLSGGTCVPSTITGAWTPNPDGIVDDCDGVAGPDNVADLVSRWDDGIADYSISRGGSDPYFAAGMAFWNRTSKTVEINNVTFHHSGRAGNAGTTADRRARAHVVIYNAEQPAGWSYANMNSGGGWSPGDASFWTGGNCDDSGAYGLAACAGNVYARRQVDFYVRPREGFQTVGFYPPVTMPAPAAGSATTAYVFIQQTGAEAIEVGLDSDSFFSPYYSAPASSPPLLTMFEVIQKRGQDISNGGAAPLTPDHMDMISINGSSWKQVRQVMPGTNAVPMIRMGFGFPWTRPQETTDFEKGLPVLKLLFNTPTFTAASNPQRLRPVEPMVDALLAMLIPIDVKSNPVPGPNRVPADCALTQEIGDYVYLPRLGTSPFNLQTCQEAAVGLGCANPTNALAKIGDYDPNSPYPNVLCSRTVRGLEPIDLDLQTDNVTPFELFVPLFRRLMLTTYSDPDLTDSVSNDIILFDTLPFFDLIVTAVPPLSEKEETLLGAGTMTAPVDRILQAMKVLTTASADPAVPYVNFFPGVTGKTECGDPTMNQITANVAAAPAPTAGTFAITPALPVTTDGFYKGWSLKVLTGHASNVGQNRVVTGYSGGLITVSPPFGAPYTSAILSAGNQIQLTSVACVESIDLFNLVSTLTRTRQRTDMTTGITTTESDLIRLVRNFSSAFFEEPSQPLSFTPRELAPRVISSQVDTTVTVSDGYGKPLATEACAEGSTSITGCKYLVDVSARQGQIPGIDDLGGAIGGSAPMKDAVLTVSRGSEPTQNVANALHFAAYNSAGKTRNGMLWYYLWNPPAASPAGGARPGTNEIPASSQTAYTVAAGDVLEYGILIPSTSHIRRAGVEIVFRGLTGTADVSGNPTSKDGGIDASDNCYIQSGALPNTGDTYMDPFSPDNRDRFAAMTIRDRRCLQGLTLSFDGGTDQHGIGTETNNDLSNHAVDKWLIRRIPLTRTGINEVTHLGYQIAGATPADAWSGIYFVFDAATEQAAGRAEAYVSFVRIVNGNTVKLNVYDGGATRPGSVELCDSITSGGEANAAQCFPTSGVWGGLNEELTTNLGAGSFPAVNDGEYVRQGVDICPSPDCTVGANISTAGALGKVIAKTLNRVEIQANNANGQIRFPIRPSEMPFAADLHVQLRCGETEFTVTTGDTSAPYNTFTAQGLGSNYYTSGDLAAPANRTLYFLTGGNTSAGQIGIGSYTVATEQIVLSTNQTNPINVGDTFKVYVQCPNQTDPVINDYMSRSGDSGPFTFIMNTRLAPRPWKWRNTTPVAQSRPVFRIPAIDDPAVVNNVTIGEPAEDDAFYLTVAIEDQYGDLFYEYRNPASPGGATTQNIDAEYGILMPRLLKAEYTGWDGGTRSEVSQTVIGTGANKSLGAYVWAPGDFLEYEIYYPMTGGNQSINTENSRPNAPSLTVDMQSYDPRDGSNDFRSAGIFGMPAPPDATYGYTMERFSCTSNSFGCTTPVIEHRTLDQNGVPGAPRIHFHTSTPVKQWGGSNVSPQPMENFYYRRMPIPSGMILSPNDTNSTEPIARASRIFLMAWRGTGTPNNTGTIHSYIRNIRVGSGNSTKKKVWDANRVTRISSSACNDYTVARPAYCPANGVILSTSTGVLAGSRVLLLTESEYVGNAPAYSTGVLTDPAGQSWDLFSTTGTGAPGTVGARIREISNSEKDPQITLTAAPPSANYRNGAFIPVPDWNNEANCRLGRSSVIQNCATATDSPGGSTAYGSMALRFQGAPNTTGLTNAAVGAARFCQNGTARCSAASNFTDNVNTSNHKVTLKPTNYSSGRYRSIYTMSPASGLHEVMVRVNTVGGSCSSGSCVANLVENYAQLVPTFTWNVNGIPPPAPTTMEFANNYAQVTIDLPTASGGCQVGTTGNDMLVTARRLGAQGATVSVKVNVVTDASAESVSVIGPSITVNVRRSRNGAFVTSMINEHPQAQDLAYAALTGANANLCSTDTAYSVPLAQLLSSGTVYATDRTSVTVGSAPQRLQVRVYTQYDRPTVNRAIIDPAGANNGVRLTARNAGDAGSGVSVRVAATRSDCTTPVTAITVVGKQIILPLALTTTGQTASQIVNLINNSADASALVIADLNGTDNGTGTWPVPTTPTGCVAYEAVLSPVNAGSGTGTPGAPGSETTRRPWSNPIPVTFQVKSPKNAIRMRGIPQVPGAYLGLRINSGIVNRPVVAYDTGLMTDERDTLTPICLCGASSPVCGGAAACGAAEQNENLAADGDNIIVLNQQAGFQPGDRIRILRVRTTDASAENVDFTAKVTSVSVRPDSASPATYREWLELGDIRWLSEQCDMTSATDRNAVAGINKCDGAGVDVSGQQIVYVNPNTGSDDKFCFVAAQGTPNACQYDYSRGVNGTSGTTPVDVDWRWLNCSSGNFDRGPDGVWHHVILYTSLDTCGLTDQSCPSDRYRSCLRNNYYPSGTPGDLTTNLAATGYWQINSNALNSRQNVDEIGFSTQIGAVRFDYGDNGSGVMGNGNKVHYNYTINAIILTLELDADYNLVPGFLNHDFMIPARPGGQNVQLGKGKMGADFAGMFLIPQAVDGWFPGNANDNHVVATSLRTTVTDYSAFMWVNPFNSQIYQTNKNGNPTRQEAAPTRIVGDTNGVDANIRINDTVAYYGDSANDRLGLFFRRTIGLPRRALWAGGYNNVQTRIVRQGDGASPSYLKATVAAQPQNIWSRTGLFLAMTEQSGETGGTNWREFYTSHLSNLVANEKMTIAAKSLGNTVPLSLPIYFTDKYYDGESVLPSHMVSNYSYFHYMASGTDCPVATPPGAPIPDGVASCRSPTNPRNAGGQFPFYVDRIEVSGARVKALSGAANNARLLYPAMPATNRSLCSIEAQQNPGGAPPQCAGGLSRPGGFAAVRANDAGGSNDGTAAADLYWPSFGRVMAEVEITAPGVPAAVYRRDVLCPAGGCPP